MGLGNKWRFTDQVITLAVKCGFAKRNIMIINSSCTFRTIFVGSHKIMQCSLRRNTECKNNQ